MARIDNVQALEVLDSRGHPTVCVRMTSADKQVYATVPSGASTGSKEVLELRDGGKRYGGKGVQKAVRHVNERIAPALMNRSADDQYAIDALLCDLDGTENKASLGANAILAVSLANARLAAAVHAVPLFRWLAGIFGNDTFTLPTPMMNIINGGRHADNLIDIQEFMIRPIGFSSFATSLQAGVEVFHMLKSILKDNNMITAVGDEGGFAPDLSSTAETLDMLLLAIERAGYTPGQEIDIALDVAASELYANNKYHFSGEHKALSSDAMVRFMQDLSTQYPITAIEDPMHEEDWHGWQLITERIGKNVQLVGDDLFVTNQKILQKGIEQLAANAILIKCNQIGTLSETFRTIQLAKDHNYGTIISHRSGDSCDTFIADLAVAVASGQIKTGSLCRSDRVAKYNRLLWIEHQLCN